MPNRRDFTCFKCSRCIIGNYAALTSHIRLMHSIRTSGYSQATLICGQNGCRLEFSHWSNYRYHLTVCSRFEQQCVPPVRENVNVALPDSEVQEQPNDLLPDSVQELHEMEAEHHEEDANPCAAPTDYRMDIARMMLHMKAQYLCSHESLNYMANELSRIEKEQSNDQSVSNSLQHLNSQRKRHNFFKAHFNIFETEEIYLGSCLENRIDSEGRSVQVNVSKTFCYTSLHKYLSVLCSKQSFLDLIDSEMPSSDGFIRSSRDGMIMQRHPLLREYPRSLRIQIFFDEVEVVNPLGSKVKKQELGMFYFTILNVPLAIRTRLENMYNFAVIRSCYLSHEAFDKIFHLLGREIEQLESPGGMQLIISGNAPFSVRGTLIAVCGDTKGLHQMFGFLSPSANYLCRQCLIERSEISIKRSEREVTLRSRENYHDVEVGEFGVVHKCALNRGYFDVTKNSIFDGLHDFYEGVGPFLIKLCLYQWYLRPPGPKKITASLLNSRIKRFHFSKYDSKNKPSQNFTKKRLQDNTDYSTKQRGAQNGCLIRMFPLLIGDLIPRGNKHFGVLLAFLRIMNSCFGRVALEKTYMLEDDISELFILFSEAFPTVTPINKFHHLIHFPECIRLHGPVTEYWTMRYEAMHYDAKRVCRSSYNYTNVAKTVASHYCSKFCDNMQGADPFETKFDVGKSRTCTWADINIHGEYLDYNLNQEDCVTIPSWISLNGWKYMPGSVTVLKYSNETTSGHPKFGKIEKIVLSNENRFAIIECLKTITFDDHFHSFVLQHYSPEKRKLINFSELADTEPLWLLRSFEKDSPLYVSARQCL